MTTITIQTNDTYGQKLYHKLKADKNLRKVIMEEKSIPSEIELVLPGTEVTDENLLAILTRASRGKSLSLNEARTKTLEKIAAWRKKK